MRKNKACNVMRDFKIYHHFGLGYGMACMTLDLYLDIMNIRIRDRIIHNFYSINWLNSNILFDIVIQTFYLTMSISKWNVCRTLIRMSVYEKVVNRILLFRYHSKVSSLTANRLYPLSILWNKVLCVVFENMFNKKIENQIDKNWRKLQKFM